MEITDIPNLSNLPNSQDKINKLFSFFDTNFLSLNEIYEMNQNTHHFRYTNESLRKMINHSYKIGFLKKEKNKYGLSDLGLKYFNGEIDIIELNSSMLYKNTDLFKICSCIGIILAIFNNHIKKNSLYYIFSLQTKNRVDKSAISSVGRNLRGIFAIMEMANFIVIDKQKILLHDSNLFEIFSLTKPLSIYDKFTRDVFSISLLREYLNEYFDNDFTENILKCIASYEYDDIYWNKSSLFKNRGEVLNLFNEYIMTFTIK